jgi:hypothetical protein
VTTVLNWRGRYEERGIGGLANAPRPGRPWELDHRAIVAETLRPPQKRLGVTHGVWAAVRAARPGTARQLRDAFESGGNRGSRTARSRWAANIEVKSLDLTANPSLALAGRLLAGGPGLAVGDEERAVRGIVRLPQSLEEALGAVLADGVLTDGLGPALVASLAAVRRSEVERFDGAAPEEIAAAQRWTH